jgi:hypothetical protein
VIDEIVRPALESHGYRVERADHDKSPGIVTEALISKTIDADLVVADLSGLNPNVMYELAVRHATGKPVIQMLEDGEELPFDVRSQNTIYFTSDLAGRAAAIRAIQEADNALKSSVNQGNPVKRAVDLRALVSSGTADVALLANTVANVESELSRLRREIRDREGPSSPSRIDAHPLTVVYELLRNHEQLQGSGIELRHVITAEAEREGKPISARHIEPDWAQKLLSTVRMANALAAKLVTADVPRRRGRPASDEPEQ